MIKQYKIAQDKRSFFIKRANNKVLRLTLIVASIMAPIFSYMLFIAIRKEDKGMIMIFSMDLAMIPLILGLLYFYGISFARLTADNFVFETNSVGVKKYIDQTQLNWFNKLSVSNASRNTDQFNIEISYQDIINIEEKKNDIYIKTGKTDILLTRNLIVLPKEVEHYKEILDRIKENGKQIIRYS